MTFKLKEIDKMAIQDKDMKNKINLQGVLMNYRINKDDKAKRMFDREGYFKKGDTYVRYQGYVDVLTDPSNDTYVRVNVDTEHKVYNSGDKKGQATDVTKMMERMASKEIVETYARTKDVTNSLTISVWGREPYHFQFTDNFYFNKEGQLVESIQTNLGFANLTVKDPVAEPTFQNEFIVYGFVNELVDEMDKDDNPTGRVVVNTLVPYAYGRDDNRKVLAFNMPLIAGVCEDEEGEYNLGNMILEEEQNAGVIGYSWQLNGMIRGWSEQQETVTDDSKPTRRLGRKATVETTPNRHNSELVLLGVDILGEDGDLYDEGDIEDAVKARQIMVENKRLKAEEKSSQSQEGAPKSRGIGGRSGGASTGSTGRSTRRGW